MLYKTACLEMLGKYCGILMKSFIRVHFFPLENGNILNVSTNF